MKIRSFPCGFGVLMSLALSTAAAAAVPSGVPKDPPAPPTGLGRLFGMEVRLALDNCAVTSQTASNATVGFSSTYPYRFRRFQRSDSTWTSWTALPTGATSWDCQGTCFHDTARVEIRGCENSTCATGSTSECAIPIGVPNNGPPELDWSGIETTSAGVLGCVQSDHTEIVVRLRYAGTHPLAGYPQIGGQLASERVADRQDAGSVRNRVYSAPAGWSPADIASGSWTTTVSLDSSGIRDAPLVVELNESCLSSPQAAIVGTGGTLAPIASGQLFIGGSELEISSGNPSSIYALTSHQLNHDGAPEPFGRITPATGLSDTAHSWLETATGRDGLTYTSPDLDLTAQAIACVSDGTHLIWLDPPGDTVTLPNSTAWVTGPTMRTDACAGIVTPENSLNSPANSEMRLGAGSAATGWPVEARAKQPSGSVGDFFYWFGGNWNTLGANWYFDTERELVCGSGERIVGNSCQTCPTYDECTGGTLTTKTWCNAGNPPGDDRRVSHQSCVSNVTVTEWACVDAGDPDPTDQPCVVTCAANERDVGGVCQPCPTYRICDGGGNLATQAHCGAGSPPGDATLASYQSCQSGATVALQACVDNGGIAPSDAPCSICSPGQRLVGGVCQTCPTYYACNHTADRNGARGSSPVEWCQPGSPPANATTGRFQVCEGSRRATANTCVDGVYPLPASVSQCPATVGICTSALGYSARPVPPDNFSCERCPTYETCVGNTIRTRTWCDPGDPPGDGQYDYYQACSNGATVNRRVCLDPGETVPADAPCNNGSCNSNERLVSGVCEPCPDYVACAGDMLSSREWCNAGSPPADATTASYQSCQGGSTVTLQACLTSGQSAPADNPCSTTCPSGQRLVGSSCESCPDYWTCSGTRRVEREWCNAGSPPADSYTTTYQGCRNGSTTTLNACVEGGDMAPADAPCDTCPSGQRLVGSSCQTCPTYLTCRSGNLRNTDWCNTGSPPADAYKTTYEDCSRGSTVTREACVLGGDSAPADSPCESTQGTETYCDSNGNAQTRPSGSTQDVDNLDSAYDCNSGEMLNSDSCCVSRGTQTYQACSNGVVSTQPWNRPGSPVDDDTATRYFCNGATPDDELICASSDRDDKPRSCGTGYSLNSDGCCEQDEIPPIPPPTNGTETYCDSSGVAKERPAPGTADVDNLDKASDCTSRQALNSDSCCQTLGTKSYCDSSGNAQTELASGFQDVDNLDSVSDCASDEELNRQSCCVEKTGPCEPSGAKPCVEGYTHSWSTTSCSYRRSTAKTPTPACQEPQSEATWSCSDEEWQHGTATASACRVVNGLGRVYDRWQSTSCSYGYTTLAPPGDTACGSATFDSSCTWVAAATPTQPAATACGPATLNSSCTWVAATAPSENCPAYYAGTLDTASCTWTCTPDPTVSCSFVQPSSIADCTEAPPLGFAFSAGSFQAWVNIPDPALGGGWWVETFNLANPSGWSSAALCRPCQ